MNDDLILLNRWRLVLGRYAEQGLGESFGDSDFMYSGVDKLLEFLYQRE